MGAIEAYLQLHQFCHVASAFAQYPCTALNFNSPISTLAVRKAPKLGILRIVHPIGTSNVPFPRPPLIRGEPFPSVTTILTPFVLLRSMYRVALLLNTACQLSSVI